MDTGIVVQKDRSVSEHDRKLGLEATRKACLKSLTAASDQLTPAVSKLDSTLSLASLFQDTDSAEDRTRILRQADDAISAFLKLVTDYYRAEMQLRFKAGARHGKQHKEQHDEVILSGLQIIDTFRTIIVEEISDPEKRIEEVSPLSLQEKLG